MPRFRRYLQFRFTTLLGLMTGIAIGFAPLKLWELWRSPAPTIAVALEFLEVDAHAWVSLEADGQKPPAVGQHAAVDSAMLEKLRILFERGEVERLSAPMCMTVDRQPMLVEVGSVCNRNNPKPQAWRGIRFGLTPQIMRNGLIAVNYTLSIDPVDLQTPQSTAAAGCSLSGHLEVSSDQTAVLGYVISPPGKKSPQGKQMLVLMTARHGLANSAGLPLMRLTEQWRMAR